MIKISTLFFLAIFTSSFAQQTLKVNSFEPTTENWLLLTKSRQFISDNDSLNEELVDLVKVFSVDSILPSKSQRHRTFIGWIINVFGYKWKALNMTKQKFIGTERDGIRVPKNPPYLTEYDVNFNLIPRIRKYIDLVWIGIKQQRDKNRFRRIKNFDEAPWIYPETLENIKRYRMHCEITPPVNFRGMLNQKFYPCIRPNSSKEHYNIGTDYATFGVYGPFVADYNHTGFPEIHPYDWLWWYDLHPARMNETSQTWYFGFMKEASNRFKKWYKKKKPRVGQISVPFIFNLKKDTLNITLEHLIHNLFDEEGFSQLQNLPDSAKNLNFSEKIITFENGEMKGKVICFKTSNPIKTEAIKYWFSKLNLDRKSNLLSGYMNLGLSVDILYNAKMRFN